VQEDGRPHHRQHVYAARLHDVRFRQLETGLPAQFQTPDEIKKQRKIHDKLIEKGLQLIADSFLDQLASAVKRPASADSAITRSINYEEIVNEVNRGAGRLPGLIGFDPNRAAGYDGGDKVRSDVKLGANGARRRRGRSGGPVGRLVRPAVRPARDRRARPRAAKVLAARWC